MHYQPQNVFLGIDIQNGFKDHDADNRHLDELPVKGSTASAGRTAKFIRQAMAAISRMIFTFDSHSHYGIERPGYWVNADGSPVPVYTEITLADFSAGRFRTVDPLKSAVAHFVLSQLQARGKHTLRVWPAHCVFGTYGHLLQAEVSEALAEWEAARFRVALRVLKGMDPDSESYSALGAEVEIPGHPQTQVDPTIAFAIAEAIANDPITRVFVAGQTSTHCVPETIYKLVELLPSCATHLTVLRDAMNPVAGCEELEQRFFTWVAAQGGEVITCAQALEKYSITSAATA